MFCAAAPAQVLADATARSNYDDLLRHPERYMSVRGARPLS